MKEYPKFNKTDIKNILNNWSASQKLEKLVPKNFADSIEIINTANKDAFNIELDTLYERRYVEHKSAPYDGKSIADEGEISDLWEIIINKSNTNHEGTHAFLMPQSRRIHTCEVCYGSGRFECPLCHGKREERCIHCNGTGEEKCYSCNGSGISKCNRCSGFGYLKYDEIFGGGKEGDTCPDCRGDGRVRCGSCNGVGSKTCLSCLGSGITRCKVCIGLGFVFCEHCGKTGKTMEWDHLIEEYIRDSRSDTYNEVEGITIQKEIYSKDMIDDLKFGEGYIRNQGLDKSTIMNSGKFLFDGSIVDSRLQKLLSVDEKIRSKTKNLYLAENEEYKKLNNCRRLYQMLKVSFISIIEVDYKYKGKNYQAYIYGRNNDVYAKNVPNLVGDKISDIGGRLRKLF